MIISRTPFRMSFVGGGSDMSSFYREHGGAVVSTAINKFMYITINKRFEPGIRASYSQTEEVKTANEIQHPLIRAGLNLLDIEQGLEIASMADIPSRGTGLGSSSSFTVGLLQALYAFKQRYVSAETLGSQASHIEIDICKDPIGKQDQYAAAYGGFNYIQFHPDDRVSVHPLVCGREFIDKLQDHILVLYTGRTRSATKLLEKQSGVVATDKQKQKTLIKMVGLAADLKCELENANMDAFGDILHENWMLKRSLLAGISDSEIDDWYNTAMRHGAKGGKLLGAGGGGFLMFYAPPDRHQDIINALPSLRQMDMKFEPTGSQVIFYNE